MSKIKTRVLAKTKKETANEHFLNVSAPFKTFLDKTFLIIKIFFCCCLTRETVKNLKSGSNYVKRSRGKQYQIQAKEEGTHVSSNGVPFKVTCLVHI